MAAVKKSVQRVMDAYNAFLKARYPKAYELQQALVTGSRETYQGGKEYFAVLRKFTQANELHCLNHRELSAAYHFPRDVIKLSPILLLVPLPFSNFVILPLMYFFPRVVLTRHFWTEEQKKVFPLISIAKRLSEVPPLLYYFNENIKRLENPNDRDLFRYAVEQVKHCRTLPHDDLIEVGKAMLKPAFSMHNLSTEYRLRLAHLNHVWPLARTRHCKYLAEMDQRLFSDGTEGLNRDELIDAAFLRCLNPNVDEAAERQFLSDWAAVSSKFEGTAESFRLHLPLFLSFPHPLNSVPRQNIVFQGIPYR